MTFILRPGSTKTAKETLRSNKIQDKVALVQAKAVEKMAEATLRKAASLEYYNMLLLFTTLMDQVKTLEAQEYLRLL